MRRAISSAIILLTIGTISPCLAQSGDYRNFGFQSYAGGGQRSYPTGMAGRTNYNSFNTGFSGLSQAPGSQRNLPTARPYGTQYSSAAANKLASQVTSLWSQNLTRIQPMAQNMAQAQQSLAQPARNLNGMLPSVSRQEMLRVFMEGGTPQSAGAGYAQLPAGASSAGTSTAYSNYQTAENEASKARNAANRARYDKDQWNRKNSASQAEYAANNANYAAQRAESAAYSGDSQARGYANLARQAANRARQDANQARYNANTAS